MDFGKIVVGMMMVIVLAYTLVAGVLFLTPLNQKVQLDQLCRQTMYAVNLDGGLSDARRSEVVAALESLGLSSVNISCPYPGQLERRKAGVFEVKGELPVKLVDGFLSTEIKRLPYNFDGIVYEKKIIN